VIAATIFLLASKFNDKGHASFRDINVLLNKDEDANV
jgi:hypothetical protein